jgi:hypothetical protein
MKVNTYKILERAVEEGIDYGYMRAHKHTDTPTIVQISQEIHSAIMNNISEVINFEDNQSFSCLQEGKVVL